MLDPTSKSNAAGGEQTAARLQLPLSFHSEFRGRGDSHNHPSNIARSNSLLKDRDRSKTARKKRTLPKNFFLKRLNALYWKRLIRYLYIRFLRMRSSPGAIARGAAVGAFAGCFPFIGLQTIVGVALASLVRGNKVVAVATTFISNPLTYVPMFALNFYIGRHLLRLPPITELPASPAAIDEWLAMGKDVGAALLLGSFLMAIVMSIVSYYVGLLVAQRVRRAKVAKAAERK